MVFRARITCPFIDRSQKAHMHSCYSVPVDVVGTEYWLQNKPDIRHHKVSIMYLMCCHYLC